MTSFNFFLHDLLQNPLTMIAVLLGGVPLLLGIVLLALNPKLLLLILKNLGRNRVRTILTCLAIMVLVFMITMIWTIVFTLDRVTNEQARELKVIITDRWQLPSQMPFPYLNYLDPRKPEFILQGYGIGPDDFMYWSFYGGTLDPTKFSLENMIFFFVMEADQIIPMMDDLQDMDPALVQKLKSKPEACLLGRDKLASINKKVGERFKVTSINYKGIDLDFEIVGQLPEGRYDNSAIMNAVYFRQSFDKYLKEHNGTPHPLANRPVNLIWLRVLDKDKFSEIAHIIETSPVLNNPQVKCETAARGVAAFLEAYRDLLWGVKWLLVPAILASMALVVSNAISISVRERIKEIAVLKVLGFKPAQILILVLGESMLVGGASGLLAAGTAYTIFNIFAGGIKFPIGFFPVFFVPVHAFWWGLAIGFTTAFLGAVFPALTARSVRVSEVFAKMT